MTVYIVFKNGSIDEVFYNEESAKEHAKNLNKKWSITEIVAKQVLMV